MLEFLKQPGIYECVFFFAGALIYKLLAGLLGVIRLYKHVKSINMDCFSLIMVIFTSAIKGVEIKRSVLVESEMDEKLIANIIEEDCKSLNNWKDASLENLYNFSPDVFRDIFQKMDQD